MKTKTVCFSISKYLFCGIFFSTYFGPPIYPEENMEPEELAMKVWFLLVSGSVVFTWGSYGWEFCVEDSLLKSFTPLQKQYLWHDNWKSKI